MTGFFSTQHCFLTWEPFKIFQFSKSPVQYLNWDLANPKTWRHPALYNPPLWSNSVKDGYVNVCVECSVLPAHVAHRVWYISLFVRVFDDNAHLDVSRPIVEAGERSTFRSAHAADVIWRGRSLRA